MISEETVSNLWKAVFAVALRDWRKEWLNGHLNTPNEIRRYFETADGKFLAYANKIPVTQRDVDRIIHHVTAPYGESAIEQSRSIAVS